MANNGFRYRAWLEKNKEYLCVKTINLDDSGIFNGVTCYEYDFFYSNRDVVLQQWTGLKDSNGTDIYEGDILAPEEITPRCGVVKYGEYTEDDGEYYQKVFGFFVDTGADEEYSVFHSLDYLGYIVIGNLFQNPELIG